MAPVSLLDDALRARSRLAELEQHASAVQLELHQAIRRLHGAGGSLREIAEAVGLSHQRVHQIVNGGREMKTHTHGGNLLGRMIGIGCSHGPGWKTSKLGERPLKHLYVDSRDALARAQDEARRLNHNFVGTEHLLLALLAGGHGVAARLLAGSGLDYQVALEAIEHQLGRCDGVTPTGHLPVTDRLKRAIELGYEETRSDRSSHARCEHLLLGLARETEGLAARILAERGLGYGRLRHRLDQAAMACSFCGQSGLDVEHLVAGPGVYICERCVGRAAAGPAEGPGCNFCGKQRSEAGWLFSVATGATDGIHVSICDGCVILCREIQTVPG